MNQVLGDACGNAVEVHESVAFLKGERQEARLAEVTRRLSAELLLIGKLATNEAQALHKVDTALASGKALEHFARMVSALGGPSDFCDHPAHYLTAAPVQMDICASHSGWVSGMATRDIGLLVIELGGGRRMASDTVDTRVGFTQFVQIGQRVQVGDRLAVVHAADVAAAQNARIKLPPLIQLADQRPPLAPVLITSL
jgi:thymidine phosphorylase